MNNVRKLALLIALFSVVSCMDEDITKIIEEYNITNLDTILTFRL